MLQRIRECCRKVSKKNGSCGIKIVVAEKSFKMRIDEIELKKLQILYCILIKIQLSVMLITGSK